MPWQPTGLELILLATLQALFCGAAGWKIGGRGKVSREECEKIRGGCAGLPQEIKAQGKEIKAQGFLLRRLCEVNGISVEEQLRIQGEA